MNTNTNFILENTKWLYNTLFSNEIFYIDYWSVVHLFSGGLIFVLICSTNLKYKWGALFAILFAYEFFEVIIKYLAFDIFKPETFKDQITDLAIGVLGGFINYNF